MIDRFLLVEAIRRVTVDTGPSRKFLVKLSFVLILVTVDAKLLICGGEAVLAFAVYGMASGARKRHMFAGQREARLGMVKVLLVLVELPAFGNMTLGALLVQEFP